MSFEEDLKQIDHEIRKLKVQYDLYFSGATARPPNDQKEALARHLRKFQGMAFANLADRFLYNNVVNKFNTFQELWAKMLRIKEEGARVHPLALRRAHRSARAETGGTLPSSPAAATAAAAAAAPARKSTTGPVDAVAGADPGGSAPPAPTVWRVAPGATDPATLRGLYDSFVAARRQAGDARVPGFDSFAREVARHAESVRGKVDCRAVEFRIYSSDSKVTLKARPAGEDNSKR
jgi:hypothetical protein